MNLEDIENPKGLFVSFTLEMYMLIGIAYNEKTEILTISEYVASQYNKSDCRAAFASVGKPFTSLNIWTVGVLALFHFSNGALRRCPPATFLPFSTSVPLFGFN